MAVTVTLVDVCTYANLIHLEHNIEKKKTGHENCLTESNNNKAKVKEVTARHVLQSPDYSGKMHHDYRSNVSSKQQAMLQGKTVTMYSGRISQEPDCLVL